MTSQQTAQLLPLIALLALLAVLVMAQEETDRDLPVESESAEVAPAPVPEPAEPESELVDSPAVEYVEGTPEEAPPADLPEPSPASAELALVTTGLASPTMELPPFRFESPFSLTDCITILQSVTAGMPREGERVVPRYDRSTLRRAMGVVGNYLRARDDLHYNLVDYRWERVGIDSVTSALIQNLDFRWTEGSMLARVDAFSIEAMRGDVYLHSMMVFDEAGEQVADYKYDGQQVKRLRHSLPRREVFHLWRPTNISLVRLAVSRFDPQESEYPQIQLHAGRTDKPEHGKATIYYLARAEQELAAGRLPEAREELQQAISELNAYNNILRQRR